MKKKIMKLSLLFITVGLFSSSKEIGDKKYGKCYDTNTCTETAGENISTGNADMQRPLTPSNFLFFY